MKLPFTFIFITLQIALAAQFFVEKTGKDSPFIIADNPFEESLNPYAAPTAVNLDGDSDWDLVFGNEDGPPRYFENTGTATTATFVERTGAANPFQNINPGTRSRLAIADFNNDQLPDIVAGAQDGNLYYYLHTGTLNNPQWTEQTGVANPLDGFSETSLSSPAAVDLNGDGLKDIVTGNVDGFFTYLENIGTNSNPSYQYASSNPFTGIDVGSNSSIAFVDFDEDGDMDAYTGSSGEDGIVLENIGTSTAPSFSQLDIFNLTNSNHFSQVPTVIELDGDNQPEIILGIRSGLVKLIETVGVRRILSSISSDPTSSISSGFRGTTTFFADIDNDGDQDAFVGQGPGDILFYENEGTATSPDLNRKTGADNPLDGADAGLSSVPTLIDLDDDDDLDAVIWGTSYKYYKNDGTASAPDFIEQTGEDNPFTCSGCESWAGAFADLDSDGDYDHIRTGYEKVDYFENTGTKTNASFTRQMDMDNPFDNINFYAITNNFSPEIKPALYDFDEDGDIDAIFSSRDGIAYFVENIGTPTAPNFSYNPANNLFASAAVNSRAQPAVCDLDGDGKVNIALAGDWGAISYYELGNSFEFNTDWFSFPASRAATGGEYSPAVADIDGDGDHDFFVGVKNQRIYYFENVGSPTTPKLKPPFTNYNPLATMNGAVDFGIDLAFHYNNDNSVYNAHMGGGFGVVAWSWNRGTATQPNFVVGGESDLMDANISCEDQFTCYTTIAFADLNGDNFEDALVINVPTDQGQGSFGMHYLTGSSGTNFTIQPPENNPFADFTYPQVEQYPSPALGDYDGDGDSDLIIGRGDSGEILLFKNIGTATEPEFQKVTGSANPFSHIDVRAYAKPCFSDMDNDGDLDLLIGNAFDELYYFENTDVSPLSVATAALTAEAFELYNLIETNLPASHVWKQVNLQKKDNSTDDWITIKQWEQISSVPSLVFRDNNPSAVSFYQLALIDALGKTSFSDIVRLQRADNPTMLIAPNPAKEQLLIQFKNTDSIAGQLVIYDTLGQVIWQKNDLTASTQSILITNWETGVYYGQWTLAGKTSTQKIIINH